ncbi:hypothetical protein LY76DRAFT_243420 [Colletotrichum caudatum]|nr:hypothetical protein LY76DRAFT_243420 [Colletotrichum caudatum]
MERLHLVYMQRWINFAKSVGEQPMSWELIPKPKQVMKMLKAAVQPTTLGPTNHEDYKSVKNALQRGGKVSRSRLWSVMLRLRGKPEGKYWALDDKPGARAVIHAMVRLARSMAARKSA